MTEWRFFKFIQSFSHLVILKKFFPKIIAIIGSHILLSRQRKLFSSAGNNIKLSYDFLVCDIFRKSSAQ